MAEFRSRAGGRADNPFPQDVAVSYQGYMCIWEPQVAVSKFNHLRLRRDQASSPLERWSWIQRPGTTGAPVGQTFRRKSSTQSFALQESSICQGGACKFFDIEVVSLLHPTPPMKIKNDKKNSVLSMMKQKPSAIDFCLNSQKSRRQSAMTWKNTYVNKK